MAVANEISWRRIGNSFTEPVSISEAMESCGANFSVQAQPIAVFTPEIMEKISNGESIDSETLNSLIYDKKKATIREDNNNVFGIVGSGYEIVQNKQAFDFIDMLTTGEVGGDIPTIETAGLLDNGARVFVSAKFPEPVRLNSSDDIADMYAVFTTSHDGFGAVRCMITPIRVICKNTLNLAFKENAGQISFKHTKHVQERLNIDTSEKREQIAAQLNIKATQEEVEAYMKERKNMAERTIKMYSNYREAFVNNVHRLNKTIVTDDQISDVVAKISMGNDAYKVYSATKNLNNEDINTRSRNLFIGMMDAIESGIGQEKGEKGTAMWVLNGITTYYQNGDFNRSENADQQKFDSLMDGNVSKKLNEAYRLLAA